MSEKKDVRLNINKLHDDNDKLLHDDNEKLQHKSHNGKPITQVETSPNEEYLVTYSEEDRSIVGWDVEGVDEGQLESKFSLKVEKSINQICVSDDKKLVYNFAGK